MQIGCIICIKLMYIFIFNLLLSLSRYRFHPQVKRIARHRHLPKMVYKAAKEKRVMMAAQKRRRDNLVKHSKPGAVKLIPERQKHIVGLVE